LDEWLKAIISIHDIMYLPYRYDVL